MLYLVFQLVLFNFFLIKKNKDVILLINPMFVLISSVNRFNGRKPDRGTDILLENDYGNEKG